MSAQVLECTACRAPLLFGAADFGVAAGAAMTAEAAAAPSGGENPGSGAEALEREVAAELQALAAAAAAHQVGHKMKM